MNDDLTDPTHGTSEPDRLWTTTNIGEAITDVLSPLCSSFWRHWCDLAARDGLHDLGLLRGGERATSDDQNRQTNGCFYGRLTLNVDLIREFLGRIPGSFADNFERDLLGVVRPDVPKPAMSWRATTAMTVKAPWAMARHPAATRRLYRRQLAWWQHTAFRAPGDPRTLLADAARHFHRAMRIHLRSRLLAQALYAALHRLASAAGRPDLYLPIVTGLGGVPETAMSQDLWRLARGDLGRQEFLHRYGYHGRHEGNLTGCSWRQNPAQLEPLIAAYRTQSPDQQPADQALRIHRARRQAMSELCAALPVHERLLARATTRRLGGYVRLLEQSKASFTMALDVARAAATAHGQILVDGATLDDPSDACYLTMTELQTGPPANARALVAYRRARQDEHRGIRLPTSFTGTPRPLPSLPRPLEDGQPVIGTSACAGTAEGRIRLITDLDEANQFQHGEILLCHTTDPSWTTLFTFARAAVIDVGGIGSHGAIVAREFGIPCVIGTVDGTRRLGTGDLVRVDGTTGTVHHLIPTPPTPQEHP